jgi:hypothetical protein
MMLAAGSGGEEAVALANRNLEVRPGKQGEAALGRERRLVYQIALGTALIGARRFAEAEREIHDTLAQNRDWDINHDLLWCTYHLLVKALEAEGERKAAFGAGEQGLKAALAEPEEGFGSDVMRAVAARDYASGVARWPGSSDADRAEARRALDRYCSKTGNRFEVLAATLFESMPEAREIQATRKLLGTPPAPGSGSQGK